MTQMRCAYVDGRWGQIHLRIAGQGGANPLLLLHPTPKSGWIYEGLMQRLAQNRIVIAPDTPGYGASAAPPEPPAIEDYAGQMFAAVDALEQQAMVGSGPVDVLGYHTGSVTAVAMAALHPERVGRLILVSLPAYDAAQRLAKREGLKNWKTPAGDGAHLMAMWQLMQGLIDPRADHDWKHASLVENLRPGARAPWGYDAVYRYDLQRALDVLSHPALILNPEDDLWDVTRINAPRARTAEYVELPGMGHGLFDIETARITELVEGFLGRSTAAC